MKKVIIALLLIGCGFWLYHILNSYDYVSSNYKTYKDIDFEKGWIPKQIPSSSYDIHEVHNTDTNELLIFFKCNDLKDFISKCKNIDVQNPLSKTSTLKKFKSTLDTALLELKNGFNFYSCSYNENYINAINQKTNKVYIFER